MKQREIKFRVWVKPEHWNEDENIGLMTNGLPLGGWNEWWINIMKPFDENQSLDGEFIVGEHIDIMQFTGLKDKKGVEIYEGDYLVDRWPDEDTGDEMESLLPVVWDHENLQWCVDTSLKKYGSHTTGIIEYFGEFLEVKGNIFEKELNETK